MTQKIKASEIQAEADRLAKSGQMPSLEDVLKAVAESRGKYADKIKAARNQKDENQPGLDGLK